MRTFRMLFGILGVVALARVCGFHNYGSPIFAIGVTTAVGIRVIRGSRGFVGALVRGSTSKADRATLAAP
jgi:hypothetical protein